MQDRMEENKMSDNVDRPNHYKTGKFECIEVMEEVFGKEAVKWFCLCNAFKYLYRTERKNGVEDIQKAKWYINRYLKLSGITEEVPTAVANTCTESCAECRYNTRGENEYPCECCNHNFTSYFAAKVEEE